MSVITASPKRWHARCRWSATAPPRGSQGPGERAAWHPTPSQESWDDPCLVQPDRYGIYLTFYDKIASPVAGHALTIWFILGQTIDILQVCSEFNSTLSPLRRPHPSRLVSCNQYLFDFYLSQSDFKLSWVIICCFPPETSLNPRFVGGKSWVALKKKVDV